MTAGFPVARPRRLRRTAALRRLVAQASVRPADLVLPLFVKEGISEPQPVSSMPGVVQHTRDSLRKAAAEAVDAGVGGVILFGIPAVKDARGSRRRRPGRHRPAGAARPGRRGRPRHRPDGRPVPGRVHRPRPLRAADRGRRGGQRRDPGAVRLDRGRPGRGGRPCRGAERHDGRPGRRDPVGAGRGRLQRGGDLRLLGQVRLGVLRAVPRRRRVRAAVRRPGRLPAGPGRLRTRRCARCCSTWTRARTSSW